MKFVANHLVAIHNVAAAEALALGVRAGLDAAQVVEVIGGGAGTSRMFQMRAPMMASRTYAPPTMRNVMWQKDMDIIAQFARSVGSPTPLFDETGPIYAKTLDMGLGDQDTAAVYEVLAKSEG
jgi:3-hydroxyisobutyrate dehydrogenase-like beta-hydroxyacid dehydrogenase